MKKMLLASLKVSLVLMFVGILCVGMAHGQEEDPTEPFNRGKITHSKMKPPVKASQSSPVGGNSGDASGLGQALAPAVASDTISPASSAGAISPQQTQAVSPSVRQQRGGAGNMPPDAAGR